MRVLADGTVVVESADAIPLEPSRLDVRAASSRGFGELIGRAGPCERLLVCLGGTATMDAGAGCSSAGRLPTADGALRHAATLVEAPREFGPERRDRSGGGRARVAVHALPAAKLRAAARREASAPHWPRSARSSAGGALRARGHRVPRAGRRADLVVTGEGTVDRTSFEGKAPGEAVRVCAELGVRCLLFGGRVEDGVEALALSGDPARAREDLVELGVSFGGA